MKATLRILAGIGLVLGLSAPTHAGGPAKKRSPSEDWLATMERLRPPGWRTARTKRKTTSRSWVQTTRQGVQRVTISFLTSDRMPSRRALARALNAPANTLEDGPLSGWQRRVPTDLSDISLRQLIFRISEERLAIFTLASSPQRMNLTYKTSLGWLERTRANFQQ